MSEELSEAQIKEARRKFAENSVEKLKLVEKVPKEEKNQPNIVQIK